MTTAILADNLMNACNGNNWTEVSLMETLQDVSWQQAITVTPASVNTIAKLVHHLQYWNRVIQQRMAGEDPVIPAENGYVNTVASEADWQALVTQTQKSFAELSDAIRAFPEDRMDQSTNHGTSTIGKNLYGTVEHTYYHLGQIVILKKLVLAGVA